MNMQTLLLVDGSSYLYRAFHGMPDLRNSRNEPTGAIHGVIAMLRRLEADYKTDFRACVFDAKGKTFRDELYPDYKANRPPMPDDLRAQIEPLFQIIRALGWPILNIEGVEADDVIGTLARQAEAAGMNCVISTGDKDMAQLVTPHITLVNTMSNEVLDEAGVVNKFGVPPNRIIDYLALIGDTVDNVPGVSKCGPKTAVKWLTQYDSLDGVVAHAGQITGVVGQNLRNHLEFLPLGRQLVTIATDVSLPLAVNDLQRQSEDIPQLIELFTHWEFRSLLREYRQRQPAAPASAATSDSPQTDFFKISTEESLISKDSSPVLLSATDNAQDDLFGNVDPTAHRAHYQTILTPAQLEEWLVKIQQADVTALDTETNSLDPLNAELVGMSFAVAEGEAAYLPLRHDYAGAPDQLPFADTLERLRPWLESDTAGKVGQNLKYDRHVFANLGITLRGMVGDTLLQSYVLEADRNHDLESLTKRHLGLATISYTELCGKGAKQIPFNQVAVELAAPYGAEDADLTLRLYRLFTAKLAQEPRLQAISQTLELPVTSVLLEMERNGVLIDSGLLAQQSAELSQTLTELEQQAYALAGQPFNLSSPKQLAEILFNQLGLPSKKKTPGGAPSTDEEVLSQLAEDYPLPKVLLEHRSCSKLRSTYTDKLPRMVNPRTGRVHTSFSQAVAVTGRLSSSDPNLQNIPVRTPAGRRIREAFIAPPDCVLVSADYSQIELRIMAHLSGDAGLLEAFTHDQDVHRVTAAEIFGLTPADVSSEQRRYAKSINFGLIYGMSAHGLAKQLGIERSAAQLWIERYFAKYPGVAAYMEKTRQQARSQGYVETVFGRRLWLPEIQSRQAMRRQAAERAAINAPMQGTAADLIKRAMIAVSGWLQTRQLNSRLILQVHDELVLEVPQHELEIVQAELKPCMEQVAALAVPLKVDLGCGPNWDAAH